MNTIRTIKNVLAAATFMLVLTSFTSKSLHYDPVGVWEYTVSTDEGDLTGNMTIAQNEKKDGYLVTIESDVYGTLELEDVELEKSVMTATIELEGDTIEFEFEFDEDDMEGLVITPEDDLTITAERKKKG